MATQEEESRHCYICDKIFCCEDCCTNHIKKKHPNIDVNCSLCRSGLLTIKNFNDDKFFCHVIFHHLPLHCNKCGKLFNNSSDLKNLGCCKYNLSHEKSILVSNKLSQSLETTSSSIKTPTNLIKFKSQLFDNNQKNFTSPPQFSRQTSTPMQTPVVKKNDSPTTSSSPASFDTNKNNKLIIQVTSPSIIDDTKSESIDTSNKLKVNDKTPLKSILIRDDDSKYSAKYKTGRKLSSMEELDETIDMDLTDPRESVLPLANKSDGTSECDMDLTDPFNGVLISESKHVTSPTTTVNQSALKDSEKKVRFIDQCNESIDNVDEKNKSLINNTHDDDEDEDDYFDACQSISEHSSCADKIKPTDINNLSNIEYERKVETTISVHNYNDNKNSKVKMIMMIIEKNIDTSVSDLTPFIESGLRKLDKLSSNIVDKKTSCNFVDNSKNNLYIDTWQSTSKIETLSSKPPSTLSPIKNDEKIATDTMKNDGIFSTVANVIKNTIRGLTNPNTDKKLDTKCHDDDDIPAASSTICISPHALPSTSNYHEQQQQIDYINNNKKLPSLASNLLSKLKSPGSPLLAGKSMDVVSSTTGKRRRDDLNDPNLSSDYDDDGDHDGCPDGQVNSPLYKRKKIWNFRSREPLSRMKSD